MQKQKLTVRSIEALQPVQRDLVAMDSELPGFGLKLTPKGRRSFFLYYRTTDHTQRRPNIGTFPSMKPEQARSIAREWLAAVHRGEDPSAERQTERSQRGTGTVAELFVDYMQAKAKNRSIAEVGRLFAKDVVPLIGKQRVEKVTKADINRILDKASARSEAVAGSLRRNLSAFFNWCLPRLPDGSVNPVGAAIKNCAPHSA